MTNKILTNIFIITTICAILFSCKDDDDGQNRTSYSFDIIRGLNEFMIVTNQDKEELLKVNLNSTTLRTFQFDADPEDVIDVTFGHSNFVRIYTYRDVSPDFSIEWESDIFRSALDRSGPFGSLIFEITGLEGQVVSTPLGGLSTEENKTIISGVGYLGNYSFTVYDEKDEKYKSFVIRIEDWIPQENNDLLVRANIDDFVEADRHIIEMNQTSSAWEVYALANQTEGFPVILNLHQFTTDLQEGDQIEIFIPSNLDFTTLDLKIMSNNLEEGFGYNERELTSLPESISFTEINPDYLLFNSREYNVQNEEDFDIAKMTYAYETLANDIRSFWHIYQTSQDTVAYDLPELPSEFLSDFSVANTLDRPEYLFSQYYKLEAPLIENGFDENVGERIDLQNYTLSYKSKDL